MLRQAEQQAKLKNQSELLPQCGVFAIGSEKFIKNIL
jgi:hypothetical protein